MFELTEHFVPLLTIKFLRSSIAQWCNTEVNSPVCSLEDRFNKNLLYLSLLFSLWDVQI